LRNKTTAQVRESGMGERLLFSDLWQRLRALAGQANHRALAVPFVGGGSSKRLRLRRGDLLVCRLDESTVRAGLTDPKEILAYDDPRYLSSATNVTFVALAYFRNLVGRQWSRSEKLPGVGYLLTVSAARQK
jgi:hypothetical protein